MDFTQFIDKLETRLQQPLPAHEVQEKMAPPFRAPFIQTLHNLDKAKKGGVLLGLYPFKNSIYLVLMQRTIDGSPHSGQISFPGGKWEEEDQNIQQTAIREAEEEVGVDSTQANIVGSLTDLYIPVSNFHVFPAIATLPTRPNFVLDPKEVAGIIEVSIPYLLDKSIIKKKQIKTSLGYTINAPYYDIHGHTVWGATAMMMSEFLAIVADVWE